MSLKSKNAKAVQDFAKGVNDGSIDRAELKRRFARVQIRVFDRANEFGISITNPRDVILNVKWHGTNVHGTYLDSFAFWSILFNDADTRGIELTAEALTAANTSARDELLKELYQAGKEHGLWKA